MEYASLLPVLSKYNLQFTHKSVWGHLHIQIKNGKLIWKKENIRVLKPAT